MSEPRSNMYANANKAPRPADALDKQLARQMNYLDNSARLFDSGDHEEAVRLATVLRVLLHDGNGTSLLKLMNVRDRLSFVDTGLYRNLYDAALQASVSATNPGYVIVAKTPGEAGLVDIGFNADGSPGWVAPLTLNRFQPGTPPYAAHRPPQPFDTWWNEPLIEDSSFNLFSRRQLILVMANQDGGAHVDAELDKDYANLINDFLGVEVELNATNDRSMEPDPLGFPVSNNIAFASVRQVAFEVGLTVNAYLQRTGYAPGAARLLMARSIVMAQGATPT